MRLAPFVTFKDMDCPEIIPTILLAAAHLQRKDIAYLHLSEADWDDTPVIPERFREQLRERFTNPIIVAGLYDFKRATEVFTKCYTDLVAFGRSFIANPDLVTRLENKAPLADFDPTTLFGGNEKGYSDYPALSAH